MKFKKRKEWMELLKRSWIRAIVIVITIALLFIVYCGLSIWSYSEKNELVKTDAAVVLGAAVWENEPSPVFRERINHAIWLYKNGYVDKIIFTGGRGKGDTLAEAQVAKEYAIKSNVSIEDIVIETKSKITEQNLAYAYEAAQAEGMKTFTIVSDPLHMKRALLIAETIGMKAYSSPTQTSVYVTLQSKVPFFLRELFFYIAYSVSVPFKP